MARLQKCPVAGCEIVFLARDTRESDPRVASLFYCPKCDLGFVCFGGHGQVDPQLSVPMKRDGRVPPGYLESAKALAISNEESARWLVRLSAAITVYRANRSSAPRPRCPADGSFCEVVDRFRLGEREIVFAVCTCGFGAAEESDEHYGWKPSFHWHFDRKGRMVLGEVPAWFSTENRELQERLKRVEDHPAVRKLFDRA